jgi:type I restriction enzyme S subunit
VPYLRVANVKDAHLDLSDVYEIEASEEEIERLRLRVGDLLLTEGGDADKLGRGTLWRGELPLCIHQNHIFRVRFDPEQYSSEFIAALTASPYGKGYFLAHAKQTTGIATINQRVLAGFPLIAPSFTEQRRIAAVLQDQMAAVERARAAAEVRLEALDALMTSYVRQSVKSGTRRCLPLGGCLDEIRNGVGSTWSTYPLLGATREGLAPAKERIGKNPQKYKLVDQGAVFYNPMRIIIGSIAMVDEGDPSGITSPDYVVVKGTVKK